MWGIWIREGLQNPFLLHRQMYVLIVGQESHPRLLNDSFLQPLKRGCQKLKHCQRTPTGHPLSTTINSISVSKCLFPPKCLSLRFCQCDQFTELGNTWKSLGEIFQPGHCWTCFHLENQVAYPECRKFMSLSQHSVMSILKIKLPSPITECKDQMITMAILYFLVLIQF